jgi:UDP-GlcNAc:undecaprenyl-phosphate GlcNAc-1-phosphate transferase
MVLILGLPIVDTIKVMTARVLAHQSPFQADNTHLHHRLLALGLPHPVAVGVLYGLMTGFGVLAWFVRRWPDYQQFAMGFLLVTALYGVVWLLGRFDWHFSTSARKGRANSFRKTRLFTTIASIIGQVTPSISGVLGGALLLLVLHPDLTVVQWTGVAVLVSALAVILLYPWFDDRASSGWQHGVFMSRLFCCWHCCSCCHRRHPGFQSISLF